MRERETEDVPSMPPSVVVACASDRACTHPERARMRARVFGFGGSAERPKSRRSGTPRRAAVNRPTRQKCRGVEGEAHPEQALGCANCRGMPFRRRKSAGMVMRGSGSASRAGRVEVRRRRRSSAERLGQGHTEEPSEVAVGGERHRRGPGIPAMRKACRSETSNFKSPRSPASSRLGSDVSDADTSTAESDTEASAFGQGTDVLGPLNGPPLTYFEAYRTRAPPAAPSAPACRTTAPP
eukprot:ctg_2728.g453